MFRKVENGKNAFEHTGVEKKTLWVTNGVHSIFLKSDLGQTSDP